MSLDPDPSAAHDAVTAAKDEPSRGATRDDANEPSDAVSPTHAPRDTEAPAEIDPDAAIDPGSIPDDEPTAVAEPDVPAALAELAGRVDELVAQTTRFNARSESREAILAAMNSELDGLRRGERRGLLRPLMIEVCRLRDGLLRQASTLPADFDRARAETLLRSFADMVDIALEDNGVTVYRPEVGDDFEPRSHRGTGRVPTEDPALTATIAEVRSDGYRDLESGGLLLPAQVAVYTAAASANSATSTPSTDDSDDERRSDD